MVDWLKQNWSSAFAYRRAIRPPLVVAATNSTRQTSLATRLTLALDSGQRRKGLLGTRELLDGHGLWIAPCQAVHTFGMAFPIDLVYLDRRKRVRKLRQCVIPWRMSACLVAHSVLELPAGTIAATQTAEGDVVEFSELQQCP